MKLKKLLQLGAWLMLAQQAYSVRYRASLICEEETGIKTYSSSYELNPCYFRDPTSSNRCKSHEIEGLTAGGGTFDNYWDGFSYAWMYFIKCDPPGEVAGICKKNSNGSWSRVSSCDNDGPEAVITVVKEYTRRHLRSSSPDDEGHEVHEVEVDIDGKTFVIINPEGPED